MRSSKYRVSADIGGTFTDLFIENVSNKTSKSLKVLSTPSNPSIAVLEGLNKSNIKDLSNIDFLVHGQTVGLNAFLQRKGERVMLIMTSGISDVYTIARGDRKSLYDVKYKKPKQLVPRKDVHEINERINWEGKIIEKLKLTDLSFVIKKINKEKINSIAVCLIHSYVNPIHETEIKKYLNKKIKRPLEITLSHEIAREWKEYERASTSVMNAYIGPIVNNYLKSLQNKLDLEGFSKPLYVMQSNGGIIKSKTAISKPINTLLSGPVGGTIGGEALSKNLKKPNLICVDMGGTSFDMSLIINGKPNITNETVRESLPLLIPFVDIHTIGAGGGSLAWLEAGALRVGPQSAGSIPGPACYGKGGTQPTVTDANLFLERIGADSRLGGWMKLSLKKSKEALSVFARKINLTPVKLAEGILSIINAKMADAIRTITVKHGIDPREFSLVAFGGAGPMHAAWIAQELEISEIIVPNSPGTFSAWGMLQTDIRKDLTRNYFFPLNKVYKKSLIAEYNKLKREAKFLLRSESVSEKKMAFIFSADMRYIGQEYFLNIQIDKKFDLEKLKEEFHKNYKIKYGHSQPTAPLEIINLRLIAIGKVDRIIDYSKKKNIIEKKSFNKLLYRNTIFNNKRLKTKVVNRNEIPKNKIFRGPMIVEEESATTIVPPGYNIKVDSMMNLILKKGT